MLIPEAAQLVIQAGAMARGGEVFVLDMGEPVRIANLARTMIHLSGLSGAGVPRGGRCQCRGSGYLEPALTGIGPAGSNRSMLRLLWSIVLGLALLAGCGGGSEGPDPPGIAAALVAVEGDAQAATVGSTLPNMLAVRVVDAAGRGIPGSAVRFDVTAGGGALFVDAATSGPDGIARTIWTLGARAGEAQRVEATVELDDGRTAVAAFSAEALVGPLARLVAIAGNDQEALPDSLLPQDLVIEARDAWNNPLAGVRIESNTASGGNVEPSEATTDAEGRVRFAWTLGPSIGGQSLDLRTTGANLLVLASAVRGFRGVPYAVEFVSRQSATLVQHEHRTFFAIVTDVAGRSVPGVEVEFVAPAGSPPLGPLRRLADSTGTALFTGGIHVAGQVAIVARSGTATSSPIFFDVTPSPHPYDGVYICSGLGILSQRMSVRGGAIEIADMARFFQWSGAVDDASGRIDIRASFPFGFTYEIHGTIVLDEAQNASATLQYTLTNSDPAIEVEQNTWTCIRE